ncbi:MAG: cell division protein ZapE [Rickettsia sp.]|nr:cell division protein ZapE [Rickettsia sp.]
MTAIKLDKLQKKILQDLNQIDFLKNKEDWKQKFKNLFCRTNNNYKNFQGIYIYGNIGGGKTTLMKMFFKKSNVKKIFLHYQEFLEILHKEFFVLEYPNTIVENFVKKMFLQNKIKLFCIDELEIKDITDAILFKEIFDLLIKNNIFIFITNNTRPDNLYEGGLQRENFIPVIRQILNSFKIISLNNTVDYRHKIENKKGVFFFPIDKNQLHFDKILSFYKKSLDFNKKIIIKDRKINITAIGKNMILTNFNELFTQKLNYSDYIYLSKNFKTFFIKNVKKIKNTENNIIIRFINFIDHIYLNKNILYITSEVAPELIYTEGIYIKEFQRTVSRIIALCR